MRIRLIALAIAIVLALVGGFLLVTYVRDVESRALAGAEPTTVYVVAEPVAAGTAGGRLGEAVATEEIPAAFVVPGAVTDLAELDGLVATTALVPGEQLLLARFATPEDFAGSGGRVPVPEGLQELSFPIDASRVLGGRVSAGQQVGVLVSVSGGGGDPARTDLVLERVLVTAVSGAVGSESGAGGLVVSVAVSAQDAKRIVYSLEFASVWLSLQNETTERDGDGPVTSIVDAG